VVPDGFAALRRAQALRPDCVVLDVMMPGLDGHSVLDRLRASEGGRDLPVIMLTALTDAGHAWRAWGEGVHCFMTKPFDAAELLDQVDGLVGRRSA
jgi:DNA-binding response OmpR family regulator